MTFNKNLLIPCPVLTPTAQEFEEPIQYFSRGDVAAIGTKYGIVKVVPPSGWKPPFLISPHFTFHTRHQRISDLGLTTRSRSFFNDNINRFLKMRGKKPLKLYFRIGHKKIHYYDLYVAVEQHGGYAKVSRDVWRKVQLNFGLDDGNELEERYGLIRSYAQFLANNDTYDFPDSDSEDDELSCLVCGGHDDPSETLLCDNCDHPFHMRCLDPPLDTIPDGEWYCDKCLIGTGEYGFEEPTDVKYLLGEFYQMCQKFEADFRENYNHGHSLDVDTIERKFWEFVDVEKSDLEVKYGADIHNLLPGQISGFPMANTPNLPQDPITQSYVHHPFNLTKLPFAKGSLLNYINTSISGMTVPWIYIGSLLSTFCWHVEDHYTMLANYCHMGATKKWYGIPSEYADKFEHLMKSCAPDLFKRQPDLLHQLVTLMSPMTLVKNGIPCIYVDQQPNEFVITYPRVYHAGFNCGFNFNEAVNFTMDQWMEFGEKSVHDYRLIKKENVFNHFQLVENILQRFKSDPASLTPERKGLFVRCVGVFERFYSAQEKLLGKLDKTNLTIKHEPKVFKKRSFETEQLGVEDDGDDEPLCDICRTHVSYQYIMVNNEKHDFGEAKRLVSPPVTPEIKQEVFSKISISQLLTPESSPYEEKSIVSSHHAEEVANTQSANKLDDVTLSGLKRPEFEEMNELIRSARESGRKRTRAEPPADKRRRSTRLQRADPDGSERRIGKMTVVQHNSTFKALNEKEWVRLCLECSGPHITPRLTLVYETYPSAMKQFLDECKAMI